MSEKQETEDNKEAKTGVVKTATETSRKIDGKSETVNSDAEEHRELEAQAVKSNPVGHATAESEAVPSDLEAAKETETEASGENDGKSETAPLDAEEYRKMKEQAAKAKEYQEGWQRERASFDNFRKRIVREQDEKIKNANAALLESLVPTLDNFDMAMAAIENAGPGSVDSLKKGVLMVFKQLKDAILESGMEEINAAIGQKFNPDWNEAVKRRESNEVPEEHVIEQIRKGYKFKDRLIRPAEVVVAKPTAVNSTDAAGNQISAEEASAKD